MKPTDLRRGHKGNGSKVRYCPLDVVAVGRASI